MIRFISLFFLILLSVSFSYSQSQNALDFDGIDDEVLVPAASALIAGSTQLSITCWVYPTNAAPVFPDFDGFVGFRNNVDCDFYVMQVAPATAIEARLRNSNGIDYTITYQGLTLNTWQHLAVTYDGSMLRLYTGGVIADSIAASGNLTSTFEDFHIGSLPYFGTPYLMTGKVDEISLFNRALTPAEVACIAQESVDANDPGCMLYYACNQGIANGVNASITSLEDMSGHIDGTLNNFAMISTFSNFVGGVSNAASFSHTICQGDFYQFGTQILTAPGTYYNSQPLNGGCGNLQELNLFVVAVDTSVASAGQTLTANATAAVYQWVDCNNGYAIIPGETNQGFSPAADGNYAVVVTVGPCSDTSACYTVTNVGIDKGIEIGYLSIYPNPVKSKLILDLGQNVSDAVVKIFDALGREFDNFPVAGSKQITIDAATLSPGIYFLEVRSANQTARRKIVKD